LNSLPGSYEFLVITAPQVFADYFAESVFFVSSHIFRDEHLAYDALVRVGVLQFLL
jgi:hypothetical protein